MRVLHLFDPAVLGQTDYRARSLALLDALRAQGVQTVHLACPGAAPAADDGGLAAWQVYRTPAPARPAWLPLRCPSALVAASSAGALALRLRQLARLTRPDLIHLHATRAHATAWHAAASLSAGHLPLVADAERRGTGRAAMPRIARWTLDRAGALATPNIEMRAALRHAGVGCRHIAVIPSASELAGMPQPERALPGLEGAPLLAFAGRLAASGGIDLLLLAMAALRRRHPALRLLVAGNGVHEDTLAQRIAAAGMRGHVVSTGSLSARRIADLLPRADIVVFPGLPCADGELLPSRHLLNAMAQGCAIVASDIACQRELLVHGHTALLFRAGCVRSLADAVLALLEQPARAWALGAAAARCARERHSWGMTASCYRRLYRQVLAEKCG